MELNVSCTHCDIISEQSFVCYPESPTYLTYRARIEGISRTDIDSLISVIEDWVSGGDSINVTGVVMTVDSECSVAITSLSDGECSPTQPPATTTNTTIATKSSMHTNYAALGGGIVGLIFTIIVTCTVVILVVKRQRKSGSITTSTNTAYPTVKLERQGDHEYI